MATNTLVAFLNSTTEVQDLVNTLPKEVDELERIKDRSNGVIKEEDREALMGGVNGITSEFTRKITIAKLRIEELHKDNEKYKKKHGQDKQYAQRNDHFRSLTIRLADCIERFRKVQVQLSDVETERLKAQYAIARPTATEEELDNLETDESGQAVLESAYTIGSQSAKKVVEKAGRRHKSIQVLIKNIEELAKLTQELNTLVVQSGEAIDKIEIKADTHVHTTEEAKKSLEKAEIYQKRATKFKKIFFVIVFVLFVLAFFIVLILVIVQIIMFLISNKSSLSGSSSGTSSSASANQTGTAPSS